MLTLEDHLCFAIQDAARAVVKSYQADLGELGITYPQYVVLLVLWEKDGLSVKELGQRLSLDSGTLTPLLKRLEAQGLVHRSRSAADERVVHIHLTGAGRRLRRRIPALQQASGCRMGLPLEQITQLRDTLKALTRHLRNELADPKEGSK